MFDHTEVGFHEVEMEENLWSISIDPDESMREYVLLQLKVRAMRDMLFRSRIFNYLAAATPGLKELVTIGKIWELAQLDRKVKKGRKYDLVIVDAPATGHGVGFLQTPRTFASIARVGPIHSQAQTLDRFITDHEHTGTAIVALPEEMPVNESATLERDLRDEVGVAVDRVYLNGLYPERFSKAGAEKLAALAENEEGASAGGGPGGPLRARPRPFAAGAAGTTAAPGRGAGQDPPLSLRARTRGRGGAAAFAEALLMPTLNDVLEGKEICICAGSGGVGKTTTSAAIATGMAAQGLKVCVLTIDPAKRLADSLGLKELGNEARQVDPALFEKQGVEMKGELWAMMLDAKATFDELIARQAPDEESRDRVLENRIYQQISSALAGSQEYMAMEKLFELHTEGRFDLLVLDTPPSRNALDFLDAPKRLTQFIEGQIAAHVHEADRAGGEGRRPRCLGRARHLQTDRRLRPAGRPGRVLQRLQRHGRRLPGPRQAGQQAARRPRHLLPRRLAAPRASRSTRPSTSTANWSRRSCPSAASSSTRSTTRPSSCAASRSTCRPPWPRSSATRTWRGAWRRTSPTTRHWPSAMPATSSAWRRSCRTKGVIRVPYLDEDVHDLAGLAEINRYLFATGEERVAMAAGRA